ncbi:MAG: FAD-dependent oxidoreductase, partial [Lachnospiraceae bacterium]|nr:FAD-dependent oxidoreductase [Lachnospiraceae bacterium]
MGSVNCNKLAKAGQACQASLANKTIPSTDSEVSIDVPPESEEFDVVVIGCGCAGMAAAIEAKHTGKKPVILEKMPAPAGNTIYAGGIICATGTYVQKQQGIQDSLEQFYKDMMAVSKEKGDAELTRMYVERSSEQIRWLSEVCGVKFRPIEKEIWPMLQRWHVVDAPIHPAGAHLSQCMLDTVRKLGIPVRFNAKAIELTKGSNLSCSGVMVVQNGKPMEIKARGGVVIATGGFSANRELLDRHIGKGAARMPNRGSSCLTGENITLTEPFSPMLVNMDQFHGGPIHGPTKANPSILVNYGIVVTYDGARFVDEASTYVAIAKALPKLILTNKAMIIIDDQVTGMSTVDDRIKRYERAGAKFYRANSVSELAAEAGLPADALVKTVDEYNAAVKAGKANLLAPPNTLKNPRQIAKAP